MIEKLFHSKPRKQNYKNITNKYDFNYITKKKINLFNRDGRSVSKYKYILKLK